MDTLSRIKQLAWSGHLIFTLKAEIEMDRDCIAMDDVVESLMNARRITKTLKSTSARRGAAAEKLYVILSESFSGMTLYTKGKIVRDDGTEYFYVLISAKRDA